MTVDELKNLICRLITFVLAPMVLGACQVAVDPQLELEKANLEKAIYCMDILENRPDLEPSHRIDISRNECYSENFIEHSPHIKDRDALLNLFARRYKEHPELSYSLKRTVSKGDLVWMHLHVKIAPDSLGLAAIHIFRLKEGKIVEHWGVVQPVPKESQNENTMF